MIRVLVVDDSPIVVEIVRAVLEQDADLRVIAVARNGAEAVALAKKLRPDIITMDIRMPVMDGIAATQAIMEDTPIPILVLAAAISNETSLAFRAIQAGAVDVVEKPVAPMTDAYAALQLVQRVRMVASVPLIRRMRRRPAPEPEGGTATGVLAIAASTGGPPAIAAMLSALPADLGCPVLVVQHIARGFVQGLVEWLASQTRLSVRLAERGETARAGVVHVAPEDAHLEIGPRMQLRLQKDPPVDGHRPSATVLFQSLARECPSTSVGVLLTGMGRDGAEGLLQLRRAGGRTFCQDEATSLIWGMPRAAIELGAAERTLALEAMPHEVLTALRRR